MAFLADSSVAVAGASALLAASVAGFVGSPHCAAMCGPLVVGCTQRTKDERGSRSVVAAFIAQQGGRLFSYIVLGAIAGGIGSHFDGLSAARDGFRILPALVGGLLVLLGLAEVLDGGLLSRALGPLRRATSGLLRAGQRVIKVAPIALRPLLLGGLSALLPCGLLHAMVLAAIGSGSAVSGASMLAAFFLGTLPALILVAIGSTLVVRPSATLAHWLRAAALVSAGLALLWFRAETPCCSHDP